MQLLRVVSLFQPLTYYYYLVILSIDRYGFCRTCIRPGPGGRLDVGHRTVPECICIVSKRYYRVENTAPIIQTMFIIACHVGRIVCASLMTANHMFVRLPPHHFNFNSYRPYFEMFHHVLSVAMGIRVQFLAEEASEILPFAVDGLGGGGSATSSGMGVLESLVRKLSDASVESTKYFEGGHRFVPPPNVAEGGDFINVPVLPLLRLLGIRNFFMVISAVLCEWRILFVSGSLQRLSQSAHAAVAAVNPLMWQHTFIPILPAKLLDRVAAPMPFIVGIGKCLLSAVQKMPLSSVMIVNLDKNEVFMSGGSFPPLLCPTRGDSGRVNATKKLQKSYGKAINRLREKFVVDESSPNANSNNDGHGHGSVNNNLMDNLYADVRTMYSRIEERGGLMEDSYVSITQEDIDLKTSLLAFCVCLFGDSKMLFPNGNVWSTSHDETEEQQQLRCDGEYFISQREEIGDPPLFLIFLNECVHSQMFAEHLRLLKDLQSESYSNDDDEKKSGPQLKFASTFFKCINSYKAYCSLRQSFSYPSVKRVVYSTLHKSEVDAEDSSSIAGRNSERLLTHRTSNHLMVPLLERGSIHVRHVQIVMRKLSTRLMDSREVKGIMSPLWSNLYAGTAGYDWRKTARTLYVLYELLIQGPDNVVADVLGHVPILFKIAEVRSHGGSDRGHEAVQGLGRRLLYALIDLRQLVWMRRTHRLSQTADSEQQQPKEVERFPFDGKSLDFTALHSLVSDVMTNGDRKHDDGLFQAEYVDIMGKPPPPSPPPRPCTPLNVFSDDEGVWAEEEEPSPTSSPDPVVNSDSAASHLISYQEDGYSPSCSQGQISTSSPVFQNSSNSEEGEDAVDLSFEDDHEGGLELAAASHEREEERVLGVWEALTVDDLTPMVVPPPPPSATPPLVSSSVQGTHAAMAFGDGGGQLNHHGKTLTPFHTRQQRNVESSAPLGTVVSAEQTLQASNATDHQFNRTMSLSPFYKNKSRLEVESPHQQNHASVELDNGGFRQLQLNQQQTLGRPAMPRTPVGRLNQSSMVSSSSIGMSNQSSPHPPLLSPVAQMEQLQQPSPYFLNSVEVSPSQQTPLRTYSDPTAHQKPYIPQYVQQQQQQQHPGYVHGHSCHHPVGAASSSPIYIQQEVLGGGDHSGLTQQQNQNLSMGTIPPTWHSQNVPSSGMIQQVHQNPGPHTTTASPMQHQQQQQPYLVPTFQQLGQPPCSKSVLPQHHWIPPPYVAPPQEEQDSSPQMPQKQQSYLAPASHMSHQQQQFVPSGFVMSQYQNLGEQQPLASQLQQQQPPRGTPSPQPARPK